MSNSELRSKEMNALLNKALRDIMRYITWSASCEVWNENGKQKIKLSPNINKVGPLVQFFNWFRDPNLLAKKVEIMAQLYNQLIDLKHTELSDEKTLEEIIKLINQSVSKLTDIATAYGKIQITREEAFFNQHGRLPDKPQETFPYRGTLTIPRSGEVLKEFITFIEKFKENHQKPKNLSTPQRR